MQKLTLSQMSARLKICSRTLSAQIKLLNIPHIRIGRSYRFDAERVELFLETVDLEPSKPVRRKVLRSQRLESKYAERLGL